MTAWLQQLKTLMKHSWFVHMCIICSASSGRFSADVEMLSVKVWLCLEGIFFPGEYCWVLGLHWCQWIWCVVLNGKVQVWFRQRRMQASADYVNGFLLSMLMAHLLTNAGGKRINLHMTALQIFRVIMDAIGMFLLYTLCSCWVTEGC
jgi:hypothetical protein